MVGTQIYTLSNFRVIQSGPLRSCSDLTVCRKSRHDRAFSPQPYSDGQRLGITFLLADMIAQEEIQPLQWFLLIFGSDSKRRLTPMHVSLAHFSRVFPWYLLLWVGISYNVSADYFIFLNS